MAISKVSQYNSSPTTVSDYQAQNSHLQAMINKANGSMSILNQTSTTSVPYIALGTYIMMGGTLYVVDTSNYTILGSVASGSNYIRLTVSGDNLTATWVQTITSYSWNSIYNYYSDGTNALLPYVVKYSDSNYYIGRFNQLFDQALKTTDDVEFNNYASKILTNETDLNTVIKSGFYELSTIHPNMPSGAGNGQLIVSCPLGATNTVSQILIPYNSDIFYWRSGLNETTWREWKTAISNKGGTIDGDLTVSDTTTSDHFYAKEGYQLRNRFITTNDTTRGALYNFLAGAVPNQNDRALVTGGVTLQDALYYDCYAFEKTDDSNNIISLYCHKSGQSGSAIIELNASDMSHVFTSVTLLW